MSAQQRSDLWNFNQSFKSGGTNNAIWVDLLSNGRAINLGGGLSLEKNGTQIQAVLEKNGQRTVTNVSVLPQAQGGVLNLPPLAQASDNLVRSGNVANKVPSNAASSRTTSAPLTKTQAQSIVRGTLIRNASTSGDRAQFEAQLAKAADWFVARAALNPRNLRDEAALEAYVKQIAKTPIYWFVIGRALDGKELPPIGITSAQAQESPVTKKPGTTKTPTRPGIVAPAPGGPNSPPPPFNRPTVLAAAVAELTKLIRTSQTPEETDQAIKKYLEKIGAAFVQQRIDQYRRGLISREEALAGLSGEGRERVSAALDQIDRMRLGAAAGGTSSVVYDPDKVADFIIQYTARYGSDLGISLAFTRELKGVLERRIAALGNDDPAANKLRQALAQLTQYEALLQTKNAQFDALAQVVNSQSLAETSTSSLEALYFALSGRLAAAELNPAQRSAYQTAMDKILKEMKSRGVAPKGTASLNPLQRFDELKSLRMSLVKEHKENAPAALAQLYSLEEIREILKWIDAERRNLSVSSDTEANIAWEATKTRVLFFEAEEKKRLPDAKSRGDMPPEGWPVQLSGFYDLYKQQAFFRAVHSPEPDAVDSKVLQDLKNGDISAQTAIARCTSQKSRAAVLAFLKSPYVDRTSIGGEKLEINVEAWKKFIADLRATGLPVANELFKVFGSQTLRIVRLALTAQLDYKTTSGGRDPNFNASAATAAIDALQSAERLDKFRSSTPLEPSSRLLSPEGQQAINNSYNLALGLTNPPGKKGALFAFAQPRGLMCYFVSQDTKLSMYSSPAPGSTEQLQQNIRFAIQNAKQLHVNLDGIVTSVEQLPNIARLGRRGANASNTLNGVFSGNVTNWEISIILNNPEFRKKTTFYLNGQPVNIDK